VFFFVGSFFVLVLLVRRHVELERPSLRRRRKIERGKGTREKKREAKAKPAVSK
jgi:hypothetical protein